jgi:hypothetical protein
MRTVRRLDFWAVGNAGLRMSKGNWQRRMPSAASRLGGAGLLEAVMVCFACGGFVINCRDLLFAGRIEFGD